MCAIFATIEQFVVLNVIWWWIPVSLSRSMSVLQRFCLIDTVFIKDYLYLYFFFNAFICNQSFQAHAFEPTEICGCPLWSIHAITISAAAIAPFEEKPRPEHFQKSFETSTTLSGKL
jgi:hypothetical protein